MLNHKLKEAAAWV